MIQLTTAGLETQTTAEILEELKTAARGAFGDSVGVDPEHALGILLGLMADREAAVQEAVLAAYGAGDPDAAEGAAHDALCGLTGVVREPAAASSVVLTLTGDAATAVAAGREVSVTGTGATFATTASGTLAALTAWAISTAYVVGDRRTNAARAYVCIAAGTSAGAGGPTTQAADITDGTARWRFMGDGAAADDVAAEATETGPTAAVSGAIVTIETPVSGWSGVINLLDATPGTNRETEAALRVRRELGLFTGGGVLGAIYRAVLQVDGVTSATVFQNTGIVTVDSMPAKSIEAVVVGGADQAIIDALFSLGVAGGIETTGNVSGVSVDSNGDSQAVEFSRPVELDVYITATILKDARVFPVDGDALVKAAIVAAGDLYGVGRDVSASAVIAMIYSVPGVLDVAPVYLGTAPAPGTGATISVGRRDIAAFDTSRISLTLTNGTP